MQAAPLTAAVAADGRLADGAGAGVVAWWSFTKTLIAAAVLKLAEAGTIALDDPLDGHEYTVRQVLRHRAGIGNYGSLEAYRAAVERGDSPWTDADLFAHVPPGEPVFPPDSGWAYSNVGYLLLRRLLERAYGAPLDRVLRDLIFAPLEIASARVAQTAREMAGLALPPPYPYDPGWVFHGCVIGPVSEAALTLHRLLTGPLLSAASRAALLDRQRPGGPLPGRPWATTGYGTGVMMGTLAGPGGAPLMLAGHAAGGPGSVGAVYHVVEGGPPATVAVFMAGADEAAVECLAARRIAGAT